jgi:hypothetical protein
MSSTSHHAIEAPHDRTERVHRWTAALLTVLVHMLLVLLVLPPPPPITTSMPQGGAGGSRMNVTLIDETPGSPPPPEPEPPVRKPIPRKTPTASRAIKRPPSTPVAQASDPMPAEAETSTVPPAPTPKPPDAPHETKEIGFPAHGRTDVATRANDALAAKLGSNRGQSNTPAPTGPDLGVDGFHVYYELVNETRLRTWRDQGMTELFLPLPGTRRLMVCPLEVALRRGSSACRMVEMDSPQLKAIGDARDVIDIRQVDQLGKVVWSGPGAYR